MAERGKTDGRAAEGAAEDGVTAGAAADPGVEARAEAAAKAASPTWNAADPPTLPRPGALRRASAALRLALIVIWTLAMLALFLIAKLVERRLWAGARPARALVQRVWAWAVARALGLRVRRVGAPMVQGGAMVSNHVSWSDILLLLSTARITFVSKAEVRGWPGVGLLAIVADTLFIERRRAAAPEQARQMAERIGRGQHLVFFPEATSTDGRRVIPFKSTLFSVFEQDGLRETLWVQPVSIVYRAAPDLPAELYGWWGDMPFGGHVWDLLCWSRGGEAEVVFHPPVRAGDFDGRKALARHGHRVVEAGVLKGIGARPGGRPDA